MQAFKLWEIGTSFNNGNFWWTIIKFQISLVSSGIEKRNKNKAE